MAGLQLAFGGVKKTDDDEEYWMQLAAPRLPTRFLVSRGTLDPAQSHLLSHTGLSPSAAGFPKTVLLASENLLCSP